MTLSSVAFMAALPSCVKEKDHARKGPYLGNEAKRKGKENRISDVVEGDALEHIKGSRLPNEKQEDSGDVVEPLQSRVRW